MSLPDAWQSVHSHAARLAPFHLRTLFSADPGRANSLVYSLDDLSLDFSREKIDTLALEALLGLAKAADVEARRDAMAAGAPINLTEGRPALHMALRGSVSPPPGDHVQHTLTRFLDYAEAVRTGSIAAAGGSFTDVVNIGIGGSDLGPVMAAHALASTLDGPRLHFVSNVDGAHLADCLAGLDPSVTLIVIASKSFRTQETMANASMAKAWLGTHANGQMAAVSTNLAACAEFGIPEERV
ncbi:MAG: glucose-6-phosphate isomerase, partial [Pseudomonadota bacterium]